MIKKSLSVVSLFWLCNSSLAQTDEEQCSQSNLPNPMITYRNFLDLTEVQNSLDQCVDDKGTITCGSYSGQELALVFATIINSPEHIKKLSTPVILESQGDRALATAAGLGDMENIRLLVNAGVTNGLLQENKLGSFPLFSKSPNHFSLHPAVIAASGCQLEAMDYFVSRGFDVNSQLTDDEGMDLLLVSIIDRNPEVIEYIFNHGYEMDCDFRIGNVRSYLDIANNSGSEEIIDLVKAQCPSSP